MRYRRRLVMLCCGLFVSQPLAANPVQTDGRPVKARIDERFDRLVQQAGLKQAGLVVLDGRGVVYHRLTDGFSTTVPLPIASASKWVAAATIMTAVDRGELALDDPVGKWIPEAPDGLKPVTLAQLLSHMSGMAPQNMVDIGSVSSLGEAALVTMGKPVASPPGVRFSYGGASFQIAGLMAERATSQPFQKLFAERIAKPLGMKTARFGSPRSWGSTDIPFLGGGMSASLDDYGRFLRMMLANGVVDGKTILSVASVAAIETDQLEAMPADGHRKLLFESVGYGLGVWCEEKATAARCSRVSSAGAFGAYPWLDRKTGRAGFFLTQAKLAKVREAVVELRDLGDTGAVP